ncbi:MAG: AIPR family protein [Deltaproteobacteria bacterium]|nr:AIPR family protein [Deltaproteobacteria bacterium]
MDIEEYYTEFMQDIYARSGAEEDTNIFVFTERMCELLMEQGVIEDFKSIGYKKSSQGIRVDASDYNPETEVLSLFVTDFRFDHNLGSLSQTDITKHFKRAEKFFTSSLEPRFHQSLEESAEGFELAREIYEKEKSSNISRIQFYLLTNAELSKRIESVGNREINGHKCIYDIWDISRLFRLESSGKAREDVILDFKEYGETGVPCLTAFTGANDYESYLLVMPGNLISDLYDRYGERLLEQNVRTFLQFRGKVHKGLRNTLLNEPGMFFAYNNGLTVTAEDIELNESRDRIKSITNLQIVNGGQTTASIFTAGKKNRADLTDVYVQVKLSLVPADQVETVVPKISEYANTQNKVNAADFFSNHPFHLRIEGISRRLWAPSPEGGLRETHWFYERARGQYANAQANLTPAKQKEFLSKYPRHQMFTKTDLAKFEHTMDMLPYTVSLGAQKNFAQFADRISKKWDNKETQFNELYFKRLIATAILFRYLDNNIMKQDWYGGYKANIVTYSLAKLTKMVSDTGKYLDLDRIWQEQDLSPALKRQLMVIAESVNTQVQETPDDITNVTEWCKKVSCWYEVQKLQIDLSREVLSELVDSEEIRNREKDADKSQGVDTGISNQTYVVEKGENYWQQLRQWIYTQEVFLSPREMDILGVACSIPDKIPSDKQSDTLIDIEKKAMVEGFPAK